MMTLEILFLMLAVVASPQATSTQAPIDAAIVMMQKIEEMMLKIEGIEELVKDTKQQNEEILNAVLGQSKPRDCSVVRSLGYDDDGVYTIYPMGEERDGMEVWCDMTSDGGGWTVFLSRQLQDTNLDFARTWHEYANGFGTASGEYWLGNRYLHALTKDGPQVLKMDITAKDGSSRTLHWSHFSVGNETSKFEVTTRGFHSSNDGDVINAYKPEKFSTIDQDNDSSTRSGGSCSERLGRGGWWYNEECYIFNPTAPFRTDTGDGVANDEAATLYWWSDTDWNTRTAIQSIKMKFRTCPKICAE